MVECFPCKTQPKSNTWREGELFYSKYLVNFWKRGRGDFFSLTAVMYTCETAKGWKLFGKIKVLFRISCVEDNCSFHSVCGSVINVWETRFALSSSVNDCIKRCLP